MWVTGVEAGLYDQARSGGEQEDGHTHSCCGHAGHRVIHSVRVHVRTFWGERQIFEKILRDARCFLKSRSTQNIFIPLVPAVESLSYITPKKMFSQTRFVENEKILCAHWKSNFGQACGWFETSQIVLNANPVHSSAAHTSDVESWIIQNSQNRLFSRRQKLCTAGKPGDSG